MLTASSPTSKGSQCLWRDGSFITYKFSRENRFKKKVMHEPNVNSFPVDEILRQDILTDELLERVNSL
jgi:hypothetical protein